MLGNLFCLENIKVFLRVISRPILPGEDSVASLAVGISGV